MLGPRSETARNLLALALGLAVAAVLGTIGWRFLGPRLENKTPAPNERTEQEIRRLAQILPGRSARDIQRLLDESWLRAFEAEPFTEFREAPFRGQFVNVDEAGFRWSVPQCAWPPPRGTKPVFLFGGSTAFGYGVPDEDTVGSALQEEMRAAWPDAGVCVYNFGRGWYFSSQERVLLERLLVAGFAPRLAVFLDGFNDFQYVRDESRYATVFDRVVRDSGAHFKDAWAKRGWPAPPGAAGGSAAPTPLPPFAPRDILERYWRNARLSAAAARAFGAEAVFVWQPVPYWGYDVVKQPIGHRLGEQVALREGYRLMSEQRGDPAISGFLWCADVQEGASGPLYVDGIHYAPQLSRLTARCVVEHLKRAPGPHPLL